MLCINLVRCAEKGFGTGRKKRNLEEAEGSAGLSSAQTAGRYTSSDRYQGRRGAILHDDSSPLSLLRCLLSLVFSPVFSQYFSSILEGPAQLRSPPPDSYINEKGERRKKRQRKEGKKKGETRVFHLTVSREDAGGRQAGGQAGGRPFRMFG